MANARPVHRRDFCWDFLLLISTKKRISRECCETHVNVKKLEKISCELALSIHLFTQTSSVQTTD